MKTKPQLLAGMQTRKAVFGDSYMKMKIPSQVLIICACALLNSFSAVAAPKFWTGLGGNSLWSNSGNWNPAGTPGVSDNVTFTNDGVAVTPSSPVNNSVDAGFTSISVN